MVGLMGLAVLYFAYDFFRSPGPEEAVTTEAHDAALAMAGELRQELTAGRFDPPAPVIAALRELRETGWSAAAFVPADFFLVEEQVLAEEEYLVLEELQAAADRLVYAGFLEMNSRRLAVVNGKEYTIGDTIDDHIQLVRINAHFLELGLGDHVVRVPIVDLE